MTQLKPNHPNTEERIRATRLGFSLDWWSVIVAALIVVLLLTGILPNIPW